MSDERFSQSRLRQQSAELSRLEARLRQERQKRAALVEALKLARSKIPTPAVLMSPDPEEPFPLPDWLQQIDAAIAQGEQAWYHHVDANGRDVFANIPFGLPDETALYTKPTPEVERDAALELALDALRKASAQLTRLGFSANHADEALIAIAEMQKGE